MKNKIRTEWVECYVVFYDEDGTADISWYKVETPFYFPYSTVVGFLLQLSGQCESPLVVITQESPLFSWAANIVGGEAIECPFYHSNLKSLTVKAENYNPWQTLLEWPREDWAQEVEGKHTNLGYWEWVRHQIESND